MDKIIEKIQSAKNIAIIPHLFPDCDCVGSMTALNFALKKIGKNCTMFIDGKLNEKHDFFYSTSEILTDELNPDIFDLLIAVDTSSLNRLSKFSNVFNEFNNTINIDHHESNTNFAKLTYVEPKSSSNCEIILKLIKKMNIKIDEKIATSLFAGIFSDTGGLTNASTTLNSIRACAELAELIPNYNKITYSIMKKSTSKEICLQNLALKNQKLFCDGQLLMTYLTKQNLIENEADHNDAEYVVSKNSFFGNIKIFAFVYQDVTGIIQVNFRGNGFVNLCDVAVGLGGGGHFNASGCQLFTELEEGINIVKNSCIKALNNEKCIVNNQ